MNTRMMFAMGFAEAKVDELALESVDFASLNMV